MFADGNVQPLWKRAVPQNIKYNYQVIPTPRFTLARSENKSTRNLHTYVLTVDSEKPMGQTTQLCITIIKQNAFLF